MTQSNISNLKLNPITLKNNSVFVLFFIAAAVFFGFASGFRLFGDGRDYLAYEYVYRIMRPVESFEYYRFEPGYMIVSWISKFGLGLSFPVFFSMLATFALSVKFLIFKNYSRPWFVVIFYLCVFYPLHDYTQLRLAVALAFVLIGTESYFKGRWGLFGGMMALAFSFHTSSIVLVPLIIGGHYFSDRNLFIGISIIAVGSLSLGVFFNNFIGLVSSYNPLIGGYVANIDKQSANLFSGANILTFVLIAILLYRFKSLDRPKKTALLLALAGMFLFVSFQFSPVMAHRLKEMLWVFLLPIAFKKEGDLISMGQNAVALSLAGWSLYSAMTRQIIG